MKKILFLVVLVSFTALLSGCGLRERLLAPPDEMEVPSGSLVANCTVEEDVHTYVYQDDGIYLYYINDVLQGDDKIDEIQEAAYLNGESVANYLNITYTTGQCVIEDYVAPE